MQDLSSTDSLPICHKCGDQLVCPDNWRPSIAKRGGKVCSPCRRAYENARLDSQPNLREAARAVSRNYRKNKPVEARAAVDRWIARNPDYMKQWRADHPNYDKERRARKRTETQRSIDKWQSKE